MNSKQNLILQQVEAKIQTCGPFDNYNPPEEGWIFTIRKALKMTLKQLGNRMGISPQSVKEIESREKKGTTTLKTMSEVANALNMKFVYVLVPKEGSLQKMIEQRALEVAREIVKRASVTMKLEDQEVSRTKSESDILNLSKKIQEEMPGYLWD